MDYFLEEKENLYRITLFVPSDSLEKIINSKVLDIFGSSLGKDKADYVYLCIKEILNYVTAVTIINLTGVNEINERTSLLFSDTYLGYVKEKAKARNSFIEINFIKKDGGISIEIFNSCALPKEHEEKIRSLLKMLSSGEEFEISLYSDRKYDFLTSIIVVWYILREIGVKGELFRIGNVDGKLFVRIEIPLSENYRSVRESF
ncbi:MAG: hypothetical protein ACK4F9_02950 [Brevinematia bacterium]